MLERLDNEIKQALKDGNKELLTTLRMLKGEVKLASINSKKEITDEDIITTANKQIKNLKGSIEEFKKGNREDLIEKANKEIEILSKYLPAQLSADELNKIIDDVFDKVKPESQKDMGKIMGTLMPLIKGKADMSEVNSIIKEKLNK